MDACSWTCPCISLSFLYPWLTLLSFHKLLVCESSWLSASDDLPEEECLHLDSVNKQSPLLYPASHLVTAFSPTLVSGLCDLGGWQER